MHEPFLRTNNKTKKMKYDVFFNIFKSINIVIISSAIRIASSAPDFNFTHCRVIDMVRLTIYSINGGHWGLCGPHY